MAVGRGAGGSLTCCGFAAQLILIATNVVVMLAGAGLVVLGSIAIVDEDLTLIGEFGSGFYKSSAFIFLAVGGAVVLVSFLGCCGAIKESMMMLTVYGAIICVLFSIVLIGSVLGIVFHGKAEDWINQAMDDAIEKYDPFDKNEPETKAWDEIQKEGKCCGIKGPSDWIKNPDLPSGTVPNSCCKEDESCNEEVFSSNKIHREGCLNKYLGDIEKIAKLIGIIGLIFSAFLLLIIILSFCIACTP